MAERTEKLDGYTLMYLLKNAAGLSVDELISYENLNYSSPTTVNRYLNKEKHPRFPTSLTIEMVQRTFANIQKTHFPGNPGGFSDTLLRLLETDLASPQAAAEFRILYDSKCRELDEQGACRVLINDLYVKCRQGYTVSGTDVPHTMQPPADTAAADRDPGARLIHPGERQSGCRQRRDEVGTPGGNPVDRETGEIYQ